METQARALEDEVRQLCEQEQTRHTTLLKQRLYSRVGQFLMDDVDGCHWWCRYAPLMVFMMRILELYPASASVCVFYKRMERQLGHCRHCVDMYHSSMPSVHVELEFEFTRGSIKSFFVKVQGLDADRVQRQLADTSMGLANASSDVLETVAVTLYEVLSHRRLLSDFRIVRVLSKWIPCRFSDVKLNPSLECLRRCPGLYQLLVSPDPAVRGWAKETVQHFGKIQLSGDYENDQYLLDVLDEWMYILESEEFNKSVLLLDLKTTEDLQDFLEQTNCVRTPTKPMLWSAFDHVMQQMDVNSLEVMLDSFDTIPDVAFNYLQDADPAGDQTLTLVVAKCFAVLLRCLGHRFWNHSVNSSKVVLRVVMQHCRLETWRVYVTKQFIELLPPLLVAMRPPQISSQVANPEKFEKLEYYLKTRREILQFLIVEDLRPKHYDAVAIVAASRAVFTILIDCYEYRMPGSVTNRGSGRDEGALSESIAIDYSVSESAFWWPCSWGTGDSINEQLGKLWMDHLFDIVIKPNNVESLVDLAAETTALILSKHLQLARDVVYSGIIASNVGDPASTEATTKGKPVLTDLLKKLCSWTTVTTIPLQVHGALFESIGGISELLNSSVVQTKLSNQHQQITTILRKYEDHVQRYLQRMCNEVLLKGLANPFRFPVVSQHISACYLSPTSSVDQMIKRLISQYAVDKKRPTQVPSPLEAILISVHRNAEAYLRGQLSMLQSMRLYGFAQAVCLPAMKKLIFVWSRVFDMLSGDLEKAFMKASNAKAMTTSSHQVTDTGIAAVHLLKLPILINEFLIALLTNLFASKTKLSVEVTEATRVQCLDFGISFWKFWTLVLKDPSVSSKRVAGLITPLVECIAKGSASENKRAAELLMTVLECLLKGNTRLDEATLALIDSIKAEAASIESKQSTDFGRMTKKLRQMGQHSDFFTKRSTGSSSLQNFEDMTLSRSKSKLLPRARPFPNVLGSSIRQMSGKSAAGAQGRTLVDLTGAEEVSIEAAARKQHIFYSEEEYHATKAPSTEQASKPKSSFDLSQTIKGVVQSHPGSNKKMSIERPMKQVDAPEQTEEDEKDDTDLRFAALFHRIKTARKPIATCSLLPFYRQLLQLCMPDLLSGEFQNERSEKELQAPNLNFKNNADYVRAFLPLMLEECNNEIQEHLRKCWYRNGGHLLRYESEKPREGMRCINFSIAQKDEAVLRSSQAKFGGKRRPGRNFNEKLFRNGDVVFLQTLAGSDDQSGFMKKREFLGVVLISETEKGRRQTSSIKKNAKNEDDETVKVLFLNDGELDNATASVGTFSTEVLAASAIADTEWKVNPLCNLVTSAREYIALRSVDMLPEHLRTAILTPEAYKSTQSELITITSVLDDLRLRKPNATCQASIVKNLKRLDKMSVVLTDLRSTSIGKAVNKLRKYGDAEVRTLSGKLKEKWTSLMDKKDTLERAPRFLSPDLWEAIKPQYNSSQLQSIHSVLNNYNMGVSLLQGPPGTGKTKTIMGLLSGLLSLQLPANAVMPIINTKSGPSAPGNGTKRDFSDFETARCRGMNTGRSIAQPPIQAPAPTFSLSGVTSALGSILRRTSDSAIAGPNKTTIQSLKNVGSSRSRLEQKLSTRTSHQTNSKLVVKRRVVSKAALECSASRTNNILLCAPSNGAVNELVLRIVTNGLMDGSGNVAKVRAPSVHPEALSEEWISIVRLGNAGEDAPETVNAVCLPHIIRREMTIHPKAMELHALQETQQKLRSSIRDFHNKTEDATGPKRDRKALAKMHQQLTGCSGRIRRLRDEVTAIRAKMTETILSKASIIACTLSKAGSGDFSGLKHGFDALIIDEAAQAVELSTLIPIRERVARVVLVGDPKQLPATVKSVIAAKARYDRSLFERIAESGVAPSMLRVQYRMHPFLREFPSKRFYGGMLTDGPSVMERVKKVCSGIYARTSFQPFLLYDVDNSKEEDMNGSKYNRVEAAFCVSLCQTMFETCPEARNNKWSVGFVSPYKEQVRVLRQEITRSAIPASVSIEVNTVDGFQGREKDVIVFSCVRSSRHGGIGFLRDIRRLNVAITRARFCLYVIGNVSTLVRDETWAALIKSARDRKLIIRTEGKAFPDVAKRLAGDKCSELAEHYKLMHEKAAQKVISTVTSTVNESAVIMNPELITETKDVKADDTMKSDIEAHCAHEDKGDVANDDKASNSGKPSSGSVKRESRLELSVNQTVDNHKRSAQKTLDAANLKKPRTSVTTPPSEADLRGQYEIRSFRDRNNSSTADVHQHDGNRSFERANDWRRDTGSSRRKSQREETSRSRGYQCSLDREHGDRRIDSMNSKSNQSRQGDRRDCDNRKHAITSLRSTSESSSVSLQSISEGCQDNEPVPASTTDRMLPINPRMREKPPSQECAYPDHRNRASSRRCNSKTMAAKTIPANGNHGIAARTPAGRSTNVLGNILGSASKLAKSTSRVSENTKPRSSEFS